MRSLLLSLAILAPTLLAAADARPNILFLFSDDQTTGAVGCYGNTDAYTPNLDQLAKEGVRFTNHYNTTSICMASRCCVMTGLYEYRHGCNFSHGDLERRIFNQSYPVLLRQAGYYTGFAGKIGFVLDGEPFEALAPLFDQFAGGPVQTFYETAKNPPIAKYAKEYPHCSRAYAAWANDFLTAAKDSGKPFCLSISFKAPHLPFTPDPLDLPRFAGKTFRRPANYGVENREHLSAQSKTSRAATQYREWVTDFDGSAANYYALIAGVDAAVGMIRDSLQRLGFADNTVILFSSDNGYNTGSHGFGDKVIPYEEGTKSPLIIYDPRLPRDHAGAVSSALTANVDMAATMLSLAGVPAPKDIDGRDLTPLLANPQGHVRDVLPLFNFWGTLSARSMAVVTPEWKYIYWYYGGDGMTPTEELFHLADDRIEMRQLAADPQYTAQLDSMRRLYDEQLSLIAQRGYHGHGYDPYPVLYSRTAPWSEKAPLLVGLDDDSGGEGAPAPANPKKPAKPKKPANPKKAAKLNKE